MRFSHLLGLAFAGAASAQWHEQVVFDAPEQDLGALSHDEFTAFSHPAYPKYNVRIKRIDGFCDTTGVRSVSRFQIGSILTFLARAFSGYIDVEAKHLFFYFFESRSKPKEDPVLMWINGGPGCSSTTGTFFASKCNAHLMHLNSRSLLGTW